MEITSFPFLAICSQYAPLMKACERGAFFQLKLYERDTFPVKMVYKTVRGQTSGRSLPVSHCMEMALNSQGRDLQFRKPYQIVKSENYATFCVSKLLIWRQKWVAGVLFVGRRVSPGRIIVVLF